MILVKSDGLALYHLAAMVDDHLMGVTHVIRGSEWLSTFPLHGHILQAFGWEMPVFIHLSIFLKPGGKGKMSKRETAEAMKDGHSIFITDLRQLGYLPEAAVNWTALMGWSYDDHTEFFTMNDLLEKFSLEKLNPAPAAINFTAGSLQGCTSAAWRMRTWQAVACSWSRRLPLVDDTVLLKAVPLIRERLVTLDEAPQWIGFLFQEDVAPVLEDLVGSKMTAQDSAMAARRALAVLQGLPELTLQTAEPPMRLLAEELGLQAGQLFGILRMAVTGQKVSPPLFESMEIIGKEKVLERLSNAIVLFDEPGR
jgi:glutamyl-tRNA synthetase